MRFYTIFVLAAALLIGGCAHKRHAYRMSGCGCMPAAPACGCDH